MIGRLVFLVAKAQTILMTESESTIGRLLFLVAMTHTI